MDASHESTFLLIWVGFLILGLIAAFAALLWAVRSGQFCNQERARKLPLKSGIPEDPKKKEMKS